MVVWALLAALMLPQSIDGADEAWDIATTNGITATDWQLVSFDKEAAYFVKNGQIGGRRWAASVDANDITVTLMLLDVDCRAGKYSFVQSSTRDWRGAHLTDGGAIAEAYPAPGSVAELMVNHVCPPIIIPGPSRPTS